VTNKASFDKIAAWKDNFISHAHPEHTDNFPFIMIGNKIDLEDERQVSTSSAEEIMQS
jgi:Ras-related protein Rab-7A